MEKKKLKIGFYNPYFDGFGGGEKYTLTLASHWSMLHDVSVFWKDTKVLRESEKRYGLDLSKVNSAFNVFLNGTLLQKIMTSSQYDVIFFVSDGSVPFSLAKHNILHFQVPFPKINSSVFKQFDKVVCNSVFTQKNLDRHIARKSIVIYPPVQLITPQVKKKNIILSVGRFTPVQSAKKQEVMIESFKKFSKKNKGWELVLAGSILPADYAYLDELKKKASTESVRFVVNEDYKILESLYQDAAIYWHAAGYGETDPVHVEHFGISTVEAMSAGSIPIVFNGGGLPEIVTHKINGYLWETPEELIAFTYLKINKVMRDNAIHKSKLFDKKIFLTRFDALLKSIVV